MDDGDIGDTSGTAALDDDRGSAENEHYANVESEDLSVSRSNRTRTASYLSEKPRSRSERHLQKGRSGNLLDFG